MIEPDRLFETCLVNSGSDVWRVAGSPPILRLQDGPRVLDIPPLEAGEIAAIVEATAPDWARQQLATSGRTLFDVRYRDGYVFRVTARRQLAACVVFLSMLGTADPGGGPTRPN